MTDFLVAAFWYCGAQLFAPPYETGDEAKPLAVRIIARFITFGIFVVCTALAIEAVIRAVTA